MRKIILFGIPEHGNIGDAAIVLAEERFVFNNFKDYELIRISEENETEEKIQEIQRVLNAEDIILLHGGGNLGDEYVVLEEKRRMIVEAFPENKIILMPQTIHFSNTEKGRLELEKTKKAYNNHQKLTLIAREKVSLEIMKREFPNVNVILTPDIVMYLNETQAKERNGVIYAMRSDIEKVLSTDQMSKIEEITSKYFSKRTYTDTYHTVDRIDDEVREKVFQDKLDEFRTAELVITDRLHGMIFATITSTPCIAVGNYNHKIKSSFEWLKSQKYIRFLDNIDNIEETIFELKQLKDIDYNNEFAHSEYEKIIEVINN